LADLPARLGDLGMLGGLLPRVGQRGLPAFEKSFPPLVVQRLGDLVLAADVPHGAVAVQAGQRSPPPDRQ
jgi:hypothetical protein